MPIRRATLIGAGGHGRVVFEAWQLTLGSDVQIAVRDDNPRLATLLGVAVQSPAIPDDSTELRAHVAIGHNPTRKRIGVALMAGRGKLEQILHPCASVSRYAAISDGVFVAANATISAGSHLHAGVIINHGAVVDHDCSVGAWSHIAPGAILGGGVSIGEGVLIGSGAVILSGLNIADGATIGSGAVVTRDVLEQQCWVGVPARNIDEQR